MRIKTVHTLSAYTLACACVLEGSLDITWESVDRDASDPTWKADLAALTRGRVKRMARSMLRYRGEQFDQTERIEVNDDLVQLLEDHMRRMFPELVTG